MLPERPKGAFLHALFLLTLRVCLAVHDSEKKRTLTDDFLCTIGTHWASRQNILRKITTYKPHRVLDSTNSIYLLRKASLNKCMLGI